MIQNTLPDSFPRYKHAQEANTGISRIGFSTDDQIRERNMKVLAYGYSLRLLSSVNNITGTGVGQCRLGKAVLSPFFGIHFIYTHVRSRGNCSCVTGKAQSTCRIFWFDTRDENFPLPCVASLNLRSQRTTQNFS